VPTRAFDLWSSASAVVKETHAASAAADVFPAFAAGMLAAPIPA